MEIGGMMRNQTPGELRIDINSTPLTHNNFFYMWLGYEHVRKGLGFASCYDGLIEELQRNYEIGRSYAIAFKAAIGHIPYWDINRPLLEVIKACENRQVQINLEETFKYHFKDTGKPKVKQFDTK